ncbi:MAG: hypothetical protein KC613_10855 [Myxococcales bacterium]|nr:hypothetical protein [Myxococcales bacterium]
MRAPLFPCLALLAAPLAWAQPDPNAFDPLLDVPPRSAQPTRPTPKEDFRSPGFFVGGLGGVYLGDTRSYLTEELSELRSDVNGTVAVGLGWRTRSLIELGLDVGLGFGSTWSPEQQTDKDALDILAQPRILAHWFERPTWGTYAGVGGDMVFYDLEPAGLNQASAGATAIVGVQWRTGPHSLIFLEAGFGGQFDFLAYRFEDPTAEELMEDPELTRKKITGAWFPFGRLSLGYRLTALGG